MASTPPTSPPGQPAAKGSMNVGIIVGCTIGSLAIICLCVFIPSMLKRWRMRKESRVDEDLRPLNRHGQLSGSEGTHPLLLSTYRSQISNFTTDGHKRTPSDTATPLMPALEHEPEIDAYTNIGSPLTIRTPPPQIPQIRLSPYASEERSNTQSFRHDTQMEPLMESKGPGSFLSMNDDHDNNRWSSVADPGGSRTRYVPPPPHVQPYSSRPTSPSPPGGFGLSLLTSAFRKSISASSIVSLGPTSESNNSQSRMHHYPSLTSLGATSGTGSKTGTYYSAKSDIGTDSDLPEMAVRVGVASGPTTGPGPQSLSSRTSLSAYPFIFSTSNASADMGPSPHVSLLPPPPAVRPLPQLQNSDPSKPHRSQPPITTQKPRARAHIQTPSAYRIRADPHPQSSLARAGRSTHGVIDIIER